MRLLSSSSDELYHIGFITHYSLEALEAFENSKRFKSNVYFELQIEFDLNLAPTILRSIQSHFDRFNEFLIEKFTLNSNISRKLSSSFTLNSNST